MSKKHLPKKLRCKSPYNCSGWLRDPRVIKIIHDIGEKALPVCTECLHRLHEEDNGMRTEEIATFETDQ